jgi:hypothetical protein
MTPKQMYRAMRKYGISLIFVVGPNDEGLWYAGETESSAIINQKFRGRLTVGKGKSLHVGFNPEPAVEDYCNARNLEWGV